ncbi:hypothetical protein [Nocardia nova]|uniref:Uncharacterized protein n=1 Tax=Nocardia nova SH22a TaxID=1415166 RepID=W5TRJ5_9NOCA|nr:hypothetical protein [Nocardia nova]AHH21995.1 hypothetical protein NONO_c72380 [Nocardia nova SH22a]
MLTGIAAILIAALVLLAAHRYAVGPGRRVVERFDRYPPHAPMSDWSVLDHRPGHVRRPASQDLC